MQLQRITSGSRWIPELDGLRFIAIGTVLLGHLYSQMINAGPLPVEHTPASLAFTNIMMNRLGGGVSLFFVISGFILARPFVRQFHDDGKPVDLKFFYLRRVTRLEPPYLLSLLIYTVAIVVSHKATSTLGLGLLSSAFYVHNFFHHLQNVNFVTWSLEVEIEFYLIAPLLAQVFRLRNPWVRRGLLVAAILGSAFLPGSSLVADGWFFPWEARYFLIGYLLADLKIDRRPEMESAWWEIASVVLWALILVPPVTLFGHPFGGVPWITCLMLFCGFSVSMFAPYTRRLLGVRWIAILGGACYSLYLMHMLLVSGMSTLTRRLLVFHSIFADFAVQVAIVLPVVIVGSMIFYLAVERPCMDPQWPRKLLAYFRGQKEVPQAS